MSDRAHAFSIRLFFWLAIGGCLPAAAQDFPWLESGKFQWTTGGPLVQPVHPDGEWVYSVKDPTVVFHEGKWHLFCTVRGRERSHAIEYCSFESWDQANSATRHRITAHAGFFCAPQVFFFEPQQKWYLIYQASDPSWEPPYRPAFSTADRVDDPHGWSAPRPLMPGKPESIRAWLDFWIICDEQHGYLFFTSLDGKLWRSRTPLAQFPQGWTVPELALEGDIFEASHTYRLQGQDKYLTVVEAQHGHGWRYFTAYTADTLDGTWEPLAAERDSAFASMRNVRQTAGRWTDSISHGELLRAGIDQRLEIAPGPLRFVFQGVRDADREGKPYGEIPWRLGLLEEQQP